MGCGSEESCRFSLKNYSKSSHNVIRRWQKAPRAARILIFYAVFFFAAQQTLFFLILVIKWLSGPGKLEGPPSPLVADLERFRPISG